MTGTEQLTYDCPHCQIGVCHAVNMTYSRIHHGFLISEQNMTRFRCDVCGFQEFDTESLGRLMKLLSQLRSPAGDYPNKPATPPIDMRRTRKALKNLNL